MLGMITGATSGLFSNVSALQAARPAASEPTVLDAPAAEESAAEERAAAPSETETTQNADAAPASERATPAASAAPADTAARAANTDEVSVEDAPEDALAAARAQALATQESFAKSLLVASMSADAGDDSVELGVTPNRGAASYAAARDADAQSQTGRDIAA